MADDAADIQGTPILPRPKISSRRSRRRTTIFVIVGVAIVCATTVVLAKAFWFPSEEGAEVPADTTPSDGLVPESNPPPAWEVGDCAAFAEPDIRAREPGGWSRVDCAQPHLLELVGSIDLEDEGLTRPPDGDELTALLEGDCSDLASAYLASDAVLPAGVGVTALPLTISDWQRHRRDLWCAWGAGEDQPFSGRVNPP